MVTYFVALTFSSVHSGAGFVVVVTTVVVVVVVSTGLFVSCFLVVVVATVVCGAGFAVVVTAGVISGVTEVVEVAELLLSAEQPTAIIIADRTTAVSVTCFLIFIL